jgi:hypothetical protein
VTNWWPRIFRSLPLWPIVSKIRDHKAARCRLCTKLLLQRCAQRMAAHPLLRAAVAQPIAGTGPASEHHSGVVMTMTAGVASVFIIPILVCMPPGAGPPVACWETEWLPMARVPNCSRQTDFSEGGGHR